ALFGEEFAKELFQLAPGQWQGPLTSSYGVHLVRVSQYIPSRSPELSEVRNQVLTEFKNERLQRASELYYQQLRKKYQIDVDIKAVAEAESQPAGQPVSRGASSNVADED
ncbi:MAG TPA: peptidylprolyl isomerase, partial [Terriglobales bacterium]|nr:peptidylprolyl isomerase [Terriglobales bacterium]